MGNHGDENWEKEKDFFKKLEELGATGRFPQGMMKKDDEGEIKIMIFNEKNKVVIDFGEKPIAWIGFDYKQALEIAESLIKNSEEVKKQLGF